MSRPFFTKINSVLLAGDSVMLKARLERFSQVNHQIILCLLKDLASDNLSLVNQFVHYFELRCNLRFRMNVHKNSVEKCESGETPTYHRLCVRKERTADRHIQRSTLTINSLSYPLFVTNVNFRGNYPVFLSDGDT